MRLNTPAGEGTASQAALRKGSLEEYQGDEFEAVLAVACGGRKPRGQACSLCRWGAWKLLEGVGNHLGNHGEVELACSLQKKVLLWPAATHAGS
jgi:hypothetical protein